MRNCFFAVLDHIHKQHTKPADNMQKIAFDLIKSGVAVGSTLLITYCLKHSIAAHITAPSSILVITVIESLFVRCYKPSSSNKKEDDPLLTNKPKGCPENNLYYCLLWKSLTIVFALFTQVVLNLYFLGLEHDMSLKKTAWATLTSSIIANWMIRQSSNNYDAYHEFSYLQPTC